MRTAIRIALLVILMSPAAAYAQTSCTGHGNVSNCPPCYYNQTPPTASHGTTDGRQNVNVFIQGGTGADSFDDPPGSHNTNAHIWNGVMGGRQEWNNATDTTSQPGTTHRPPYYFVENQGGGWSNADVVIIADSGTTYASTENQVHPAIIHLNPTWAATLTDAELAGIIAHELAHPHGLGNAYTGTTGCESADTIMNGLDPTTLKPIQQHVQQRDVYQMNKNYNSGTRGNCCADVTASNSVGDGSGDGGDPCGGDPCCGDACCYDPASCDGGYSYCVTYTEERCYEDCWVINVYGRCEYYHTSCETYSWVECY